MLKRAAVYTAGMAVVSGGPIAYFAAPGYWDAVRQEWAPAVASVEAGAGDASPGGASPLAIEGPPVEDFGEIFNLQVTPQWIAGRWPRISTGLEYLQFQGYRVPVSTGTEPSDVAGALTYYFDPQQQAQRLTFEGKTGDAGRLITMLKDRYGFTRRIVNDPGLYVYEMISPDGQTTGSLRVRSAQVIKSNDPFSRFDVALFLQRPS